MRISDWSSDVCSSDLRHFGDAAGIVGDGTIGVERDDHAREREHRGGGKGDADDARGLESDNDADADDERRQRGRFKADGEALDQDRKSVVWGKSVSGRVDIGGRRTIKKKNTQTK